MRVEAPDLAAAVGIEGEDDVVRRAEVDQAAGLDRRDLIGELVRIFRPLQVACVEHPRRLQAGDIRRRDLGERRKARPAPSAAIGGPVPGGDAGVGHDRARARSGQAPVDPRRIPRERGHAGHRRQHKRAGERQLRATPGPEAPGHRRQ